MRRTDPIPAILLGTALLVIGARVPSATAIPPFLSEFQNTYPDSLSPSFAACQLCHVSLAGDEPWNAFGWRVRQYVVEEGMDIGDALFFAEVFDSDGDPTGASNIVEIGASTQPGWTADPVNSHFFADGSVVRNQPPPVLFGGEYDPPPPPACDGDTNGDLVVDVEDLLAVLAGWGGPGPGDVNGSGLTDVEDLLLVLAGWGAC